MATLSGTHVGGCQQHQPLLITMDPEIDTPEGMAECIVNFDRVPSG
jgi:cytochrome oxidase Cu insertion factor (SCO1/SenC/PrrC family)